MRPLLRVMLLAVAVLENTASSPLVQVVGLDQLAVLGSQVPVVVFQLLTAAYALAPRPSSEVSARREMGRKGLVFAFMQL